MLNRTYFFIQSILLLLGMSGCVFCEKHNIEDIYLQNSVETKLNEISSIENQSYSNRTRSFHNGFNGSTSMEESIIHTPRLSNSKHTRKTQKLGNVIGQGQGQKNRKGQRQQQGLVQKILPLMIIPFMISTALIPIMLFVIKLLFVKAVVVGKIAVTLGLISFFKRKSNSGGVYNYNAWKMR